MEKKECNNCVWNKNCYIQNAISNYMRHKHPLVKIDLSDFGCNNFESIEAIKEFDKKTNPGLTDYLNFYSNE